MPDTPTPSIQSVNAEDAQKLCAWLVESQGYLEARVLPDGSVAALGDLMFTRSIVLGCDWDGWAYRFCFENRPLANVRYHELQSEEDVPEGHIARRYGRESSGSQGRQ